jgi:hypothetical protein
MENPDNEDIIIQIEETLHLFLKLHDTSIAILALPCNRALRSNFNQTVINQSNDTILLSPVHLIVSNLYWYHSIAKMENPDNEDIIIQIEETLHLFLWPNNITTFFPFPVMFYLPCADHVLLFVDDVVTSRDLKPRSLICQI